MTHGTFNYSEQLDVSYRAAGLFQIGVFRCYKGMDVIYRLWFKQNHFAYCFVPCTFIIVV